MTIKTELIKSGIAQLVCGKIIDFEMIENIVSIFGKFHLDSGTCHDF